MDPNFTALVDAINSATQPTSIDWWLLTFTGILAVSALVAVGIAIKHWITSETQADAAREAVKHQRLQSIIQIGTNWDGAAIRDSRTALLEFEVDVDAHIKRTHNLIHLTSQQIKSLFDAEYTTRLATMKKNNVGEYMVITGILGFFEDLGFFVKKQYIDEAEILDLYGPAIRHAHNILSPHIDARIQKGEVDPDYYEYFRNLRAGALR